MSQQVVVITGALAGIGRATALAFADEGAQVVVSGRREEAGSALAEELRNRGAEAEFVRADVRRDEEMRNLIDVAVQRFGHVDVVVNNAGTEGRPGPLTDQTDESVAEVFDANVLGTIFGMKHALRVMLPRGKGSIVNVSSLLGHRGMGGVSIYTASKHAVEGLTKAGALEAAGSGVRVNAVAPGPVETDMMNRVVGSDAAAKSAFISAVPLQRAGTPEEIAQAIVFLGSEKSSYVTGAVLDADGGFGAR
ncbi:glucose 1-dehydrogenase [Kaistia geumhonensis]|uniref:NAD(P)-dependent dehydrogenase (Short-subunit alcohol dehydrogenase family) n=1 Tax=Kaistia geumhonensis TaxID=410839 RepID=A0ABU0MCE1_9HYPH|nr:glucose 1-dehydrogenase [Kaistia geumhonensis]MCX5481570.1 glucose 1-dehydrogenase [Kaistia geumhonensis]MDQ0518636.1 NAD(P)-dependent dehydrogenase (short-subunit alcohol dehydrogenase family) [Kaistia geumhonensis]